MRARLGDLARAVGDERPERGTRILHVRGYELQIRPRMVLLDGEAVAIAPAPAAILRKLAESPGAVFSRAQLLQTLPGQATADEHTVETAVARLRSSLGPAADIVRTVVKRGYRLDLDPV